MRIHDEHLLVIDKPGWLVCHPSKRGPLSSLVGACRVWTGLETLHLVSRLDRETSGVIVLAKDRMTARKFQMAIQAREVEKTYLAILEGEMAGEVSVDEPVGRDGNSPVFVKFKVSFSRSAKPALTHFTPLLTAGGYTLARVQPHTGRKHQIRVHAQWIEHPIVGDKLYGHDETLYLEFVERGWTERLEASLKLPRQALHAASLSFLGEGLKRRFDAPLPDDMRSFCRSRMSLSDGVIDDLIPEWRSVNPECHSV